LKINSKPKLGLGTGKKPKATTNLLKVFLKNIMGVKRW
jgi:hypothetical protein